VTFKSAARRAFRFSHTSTIAGVTAMLVDLKAHPDTTHIRAHWKTVRWGRGDKTPSFTFYVFAEPA
jgi:hypothetical protein